MHSPRIIISNTKRKGTISQCDIIFFWSSVMRSKFDVSAHALGITHFHSSPLLYQIHTTPEPVTPPKRIGVGDHFFSYDVVRYYVKGLPFFIRSASSLCRVWDAVSKLVDEGRGGLLSPVWWWVRPLCIIIIAIEFFRPFVRKLHSRPRRYGKSS